MYLLYSYLDSLGLSAEAAKGILSAPRIQKQYRTPKAAKSHRDLNQEPKDIRYLWARTSSTGYLIPVGDMSLPPFQQGTTRENSASPVKPLRAVVRGCACYLDVMEGSSSLWNGNPTSPCIVQTCAVGSINTHPTVSLRPRSQLLTEAH